MRLASQLLTLFWFTATDLCGKHNRYSAQGELMSSTTKIHRFAVLDFAVGLTKYMQHETERLEIIKNAKGYEDEVPTVENRLQELQLLIQQEAVRRAEYTWLRHRINDFHPTTTLRLLAHFLDTWDSKLKNDTFYGFRFAEFLSNDDDSKLPTHTDLEAAARAVVELQHVYNLSAAQVYRGSVLGHTGTPLRPQDAYQIALSASKLRHLQQAVQWYETALNNTPPEQLAAKRVNNASYPVAAALASLGVLKYGMNKKEEGLELLEKASDLDPDNQDIHQQFISHRFGRDVPALVYSDVGEFRQRWFQLCANSSSSVVRPVKWYHVCRYRQSSVVPYKRYREEVLSRAPFLSVLHNFLSTSQAQQLINVSASKLVNGASIAGIGSEIHLMEGAVLNHSVPVARLLSDRIADLTGLDTEERPLRSSGEPLHVFNYGISGCFLPHYDINRVYDRKYLMKQSGHRMASVLIYLSQVKAGGATAFPYLNITVQPEIGKALLWYNADPSGRKEKDIMHTGCPVAVGAKWVASKGIWSWGNELRRPCGLKVNSTHMAVDNITFRRSHRARKEKMS